MTAPSEPLPSHGTPDGVLKWKAYEIHMYKSLDLIGSIWDRLDTGNIFLSSQYLRALHAAPPVQMRFRYFTIWKEGRLCGIMYTQQDKFRARESISYHRDTDLGPVRPGLITRVRNALAARVSFTTLLCGNSLVTGSHGFNFTPEVPDADRWCIADHILHRLVRILRSEGVRVRLLFVKDFVQPAVDRLLMNPSTRMYHGFHAQPSMVFHVDAAWKSFDDYMAALSAKYRVRNKRAFKKCEGIQRRELTLNDLERYKDRIIAYYRAIADHASFNLFILNPEYFISVKQHLGDAYRVYGYFDCEKLIAFYSFMLNGDEIEAHFLGYEEEVNKEHQLYLNMLLDMIAYGIRSGVQRIVFGRTAMEIKSSVGARPEYMYFFLQYQSVWINPFVTRVYRMLEPEVKWIARSPFRD